MLCVGLENGDHFAEGVGPGVVIDGNVSVADETFEYALESLLLLGIGKDESMAEISSL